jgi:copper chaperone NosL
MTRALALSATVLGLLGLACAGCEHAELAKDPVWGKQACEHCHMLVSDKRYAAQFTTRAGDRLYFDDLGCLVAYLNEHKPEVAHVWVRDTTHWLDATTARYATGFQTPMGYGVAAADSGALSFAQIKHLVAARNRPTEAQ